MAKIMVFQHVPYEPLGTLDKLIRSHRHRIRYVNFHRDQSATPDIRNYAALIILGGPMSVTALDQYKHLQTEVSLIQQALAIDIPILGICLGSQLLAKALGATIYRAGEKEVGWYRLTPTAAGYQDNLVQHFAREEMIFQWHTDTFALPEHAELLVSGTPVSHQAFRYGRHVYGFQFHLEVQANLIQRWINIPENQQDLNPNNSVEHKQQILDDTQLYCTRSVALSHLVFESFINLLPKVQREIRLPLR